MSETRNRTMYYRRAGWTDEQPRNLEALLSSAYGRFKMTKSRTFNYNEGEVYGTKNDVIPTGGILDHVVGYLPHESKSVVPFPSGKTTSNTGSYPPPPDNNYVSGDIFFLVRGNHVLLCPSGGTESMAIHYIKHLIRKNGGDEEASLLRILPVLPTDKTSILRTSAPKSVSLAVSTYFPSIEIDQPGERHGRKVTVFKEIVGGLKEQLEALFYKDVPLEDEERIADLNVQLKISYRKNGKQAEFLGERLRTMAEDIVSAEEQGQYVVETVDGRTFTQNQLKVSKTVDLKKFNESVFREAAWEALKGYLTELQKSGQLEM